MRLMDPLRHSVMTYAGISRTVQLGPSTQETSGVLSRRGTRLRKRIRGNLCQDTKIVNDSGLFQH